MAAVDFLKTVDKVAATVNAWIDEYELQPMCTGPQALVDKILDYLVEADLAYKQVYPPDVVGVHPKNRYGEGLDPVEVHGLIDKILNAGFSRKALGRAIAAEVPPNELGVRHVQFNHELVLHSMQLLPALSAHASILSLGCSHTNATGRCVKLGAKALHPTIADADGNLSLARMRERSPDYADFCEHGMQWTVIRHHVEVKCPRLFDLLQQGANIGQQSAIQESPMSVLLALHQEMLKGIQWKEAAAKLARLKPPHAASMLDMAEFVHVWSGGEDGWMLKGISQYVKGLAYSHPPPARAWGSLAKLTLTQAPLYIQAVVKAFYSAHTRFVRDGESRLLTSADIGAIAGRIKPFAMQATVVMTEFRAMLDAAMFVSDRTRCIGDLDVALVLHVHGKCKDSATIHDVARLHYDDLKRQHGELMPPMPNAWGVAVTPSDSHKASTIRCVTADASLAHASVELARKGFKVGSQVHIRESADVIFEITALDGNSVDLKHGKDEAVKVTAEKLLDEYVVAKMTTQDRVYIHIYIYIKIY